LYSFISVFRVLSFEFEFGTHPNPRSPTRSCAWCYIAEEHAPKWECCLIGSPQPSCPAAGGGALALGGGYGGGAADGGGGGGGGGGSAYMADKDRAILQSLLNGVCPRMLIMARLQARAPRPTAGGGGAAVGAAARAAAAAGGAAGGRSGWYEVVSEQSTKLGAREAFLMLGHHLTLPGNSVQARACGARVTGAAGDRSTRVPGARG
jgi:hypothetical protein